MKRKILFILLAFLCVAANAKSKAKPLDDVIEEAAEKFIEKAEVGSKVFLGIFEATKKDGTKSAELENYVMNYLQSLIVDSGALDVSERAQLESLQAEIDYQQAGNVKDEEWAEMGRQDGAQYAIYGKGEWKANSYVITLKMTHVESAKIVVNYRGEVIGKDKELKRMMGKIEEEKPSKKKALLSKMTVGAIGGLHAESGKYGEHGDKVIKEITDNASNVYTVSDKGYNALTGGFFFNYRLRFGFGLETGAFFWNGGGEIVVTRGGDEQFYAEKYKLRAVDVPLALSFQFKLFRTSIKLQGGLNLAVPLESTFVFRGRGNGAKVDFSPERAVIPGFILGADYMIPIFRRAGLDFAVRYEKDFLPYEINYESEVLELFNRSSVNFMAGVYFIL